MKEPIIMNKISSGISPLVRNILPRILIAAFTLIFVGALYLIISGVNISVWFFVGLLAVGALVYIVWKASIKDLADEVFDCGEYLLIRKNKQEIRINLGQISQFYYSYDTNNPYVLLSVSESERGRDEQQYHFNVPNVQGFAQPDPEIIKLEKRIKKVRKSN